MREHFIKNYSRKAQKKYPGSDIFLFKKYHWVKYFNSLINETIELKLISLEKLQSIKVANILQTVKGDFNRIISYIIIRASHLFEKFKVFLNVKGFLYKFCRNYKRKYLRLKFYLKLYFSTTDLRFMVDPPGLKEINEICQLDEDEERTLLENFEILYTQAVALLKVQSDTEFLRQKITRHIKKREFLEEDDFDEDDYLDLYEIESKTKIKYRDESNKIEKYYFYHDSSLYIKNKFLKPNTPQFIMSERRFYYKLRLKRARHMARYVTRRRHW
jgi:hypothetical protein